MFYLDFMIIETTFNSGRDIYKDDNNKNEEMGGNVMII